MLYSVYRLNRIDETFSRAKQKKVWLISYVVSGLYLFLYYVGSHEVANFRTNDNQLSCKSYLTYILLIFILSSCISLCAIISFSCCSTVFFFERNERYEFRIFILEYYFPSLNSRVTVQLNCIEILRLREKIPSGWWFQKFRSGNENLENEADRNPYWTRMNRKAKWKQNRYLEWLEFSGIRV